MVFSRLFCENDLQYNAFEKLVFGPMSPVHSKDQNASFENCHGSIQLFKPVSQNSPVAAWRITLSRDKSVPFYGTWAHTNWALRHPLVEQEPSTWNLCSKEMRGIKKERKNLWSPECQQITTVKHIKRSTLIFDQMSLYKVRTGSNGALKKITGPLRTQYMSV